MAIQVTNPHEMLQHNDIFRELKAAMEAHQTNLRLDINHMEVIVGCIAKSTDDEVMKYLPDVNESISSLRECLSTLQVHWRIFEIKRGHVHAAEIDMNRTVPSRKGSPMRQ
ncbi:MAG: hypothetical protein ABSF53_19705 [Terracidiphilus sp.]|jgi:hypothetical protein